MWKNFTSLLVGKNSITIPMSHSWEWITYLEFRCESVHELFHRIYLATINNEKSNCCTIIVTDNYVESRVHDDVIQASLFLIFTGCEFFRSCIPDITRWLCNEVYSCLLFMHDAIKMMSSCALGWISYYVLCLMIILVLVSYSIFGNCLT